MSLAGLKGRITTLTFNVAFTVGDSWSPRHSRCVCVCVCVCVFVGITQNHFMHYAHHQPNCVTCLDSVSMAGEVYVTALLFSCGSETTFHLTVLPCVMSTRCQRAGCLGDNPPDSQTIQVCEKIYRLHPERHTRKGCMNRFHTYLTSAYTGWAHGLNHFKPPKESPPRPR